jgi:hypothetical protein
MSVGDILLLYKTRRLSLMGKGTQKDLFHGQGNSTVSLPSHLKGKTKLTDPHTSPGVLLKGTKKKVQKGWNK